MTRQSRISAISIALFVASCAAQRTPATIGAATMATDGTIHVTLRAEGPGGMIGDGAMAVEPGDENYEEWLEHLNGLTPGETQLVPPWEEP